MNDKTDTGSGPHPLPELRRCYDCGQPMGRKAVYCPRCGAKQPREPRRGSARG